jgi:hypothetical protein
VFLGVVAVVTVAIFGVQKHFADKERMATEETKRKSDERKKIANAQSRQKALQSAAAAEHERFLTKYVNTNITKRAGSQMVAVAVVSEAGTINHAIGATLVKHFQREGVQFTDSFFKPEMATDGLFSTALNGSSDLFTRLELAKSLDAVLLARQQVQYETNSDLKNIVTAAMQLEVVVLPVAGRMESKSWQFSANGAAFRPADARMQAEERIVKKIETNATMTLPRNPQ